MKTYLRYYDVRFGDVFEIYVDHDGEFITAKRSVAALNNDPIYYDSLGQIPMTHRQAIVDLLESNANNNK